MAGGWVPNGGYVGKGATLAMLGVIVVILIGIGYGLCAIVHAINH